MDQAAIREWVERKIARLERQRNEIDAAIEQFKGFRSAIDKMPAELLGTDDDEADEGNSDSSDRTHFERIATFMEQATQAQSIVDIEQGTGIPRTSISAVLYRTHKDAFGVMSNPEGKKFVHWYLKNSELGRQIASESQEEEIPF